MIYAADQEWEQDPSKSINGNYYFLQLSPHETETINHVLSIVKDKYPAKYKAIGLANESYVIKYKPRYILYEIIILKYCDSAKPLDQLAVAIAYSEKGAYYRKQAIQYFEKSIISLKFKVLNNFASYQPLHILSIFADIYEKEHQYEKAIKCTRAMEKYGDYENPNLTNKISVVTEKLNNPPKQRKTNIPQEIIEMENNIATTAKRFL